MNNKSHWFSWIIFESEPGCTEHVSRALTAGAEVYCHGGELVHYHCLLYVAKPEYKDHAKSRLGRSFDSSFGIPKNPDATRRYIRVGGKKVTQV